MQWASGIISHHKPQIPIWKQVFFIPSLLSVQWKVRRIVKNDAAKNKCERWRPRITLRAAREDSRVFMVMLDAEVRRLRSDSATPPTMSGVEPLNTEWRELETGRRQPFRPSIALNLT